MASLGSATCSRCGASIAPGVVRCPFCGTSVGGARKDDVTPIVRVPFREPSAPAASPEPRPSAPSPMGIAPHPVPSARPRPPIVRSKKQPPWVVAAVAAGIVLTGVLAISLLGKGSSSTPTSSSMGSSAPATTVVRARTETPFFSDPAHVDASDLYPRVKERALAWNPDAHLVSIAASPVVGDKVDLTQEGAEIVYLFGADDSARTPPFGRLAITARHGGLDQAPTVEPAKPVPAKPVAKPAPKPVAAKANTRTPPAPAASVVEPNCVFDAAAKAARASGVPAGTVMKLRYETDPTLNRGVWTARVPGRAELDRVMDGQTCAIVARKR
jgi:hypothetical protein